MSSDKETAKTPMAKRVIALAGVLLLVGVYVRFFIYALFGKTGAGSAFVACAAATVAIPIFTWLLLWAYTALTGKRTVASSDPYGKFDNAEDKEDK